MKLIEYATMYLDRGFSVIPLRPRDKHPPEGFKWKEYQSRRPTEEEIYQWFGDGAEHSIGIVTGAVSGLCVVDLDSQRAVEFSKIHGFPRTPMVKTGKGYHLYYKYTEGVRNFQNRRDLPDIDLRGEGGYVVAPPSIHESGRQYVFQDGYSLYDLQLAEVPDILLSAQENKPPPSGLVKGVPKGSRNDSLARLCGSWIRQKLLLQDCLENASVWNARNDPPLPEGEVEKTVRSIWEKDKRESGEEPKEKEDILSFVGLPMSLGSLMEADIPDPVPLMNELIYREELIMLAGPQKIGKTVLGANIGLSLASGRPWHGYDVPVPVKTLYVQQEVSLSRFKQRLRQMVQVLSPEELDAVNTHFHQATTKGLLFDSEAHMKIFRSWIGEIGPQFIVLDPLYTFHLGNENSTQEMNRFVRVIQRLMADYQVTVLIVHHFAKPSEANKTGSDLLRGSGVLAGAADTNLMFHKVNSKKYKVAHSLDHYGELQFETRNIRAPENMLLFRDDESLWYEQVEQETVQKVTAGDVIRYLLEHGPTMRKVLIEELMKEYEAAESTVKRAIMKAKDVHSRRTTGHGRPVELYLDKQGNYSDCDEDFEADHQQSLGSGSSGQ